MTNYKTEKEKQGKEFKKSFIQDKSGEKVAGYLTAVPEFLYPEEELPAMYVKNVKIAIPDDIKSYILSRDTALLEAFKKDVGELSETTGCVGAFVSTSPNEAKGWCCPRHYGQNDLLSLLKDYNLNK